VKKRSSEDLDDDLRPHETFRPIYLDDDVAEVFDSSEAVNTVLRSAIRAMRSPGAKPASRPASSKNRGS